MTPKFWEKEVRSYFIAQLGLQKYPFSVAQYLVGFERLTCTFKNVLFTEYLLTIYQASSKKDSVSSVKVTVSCRK